MAETYTISRRHLPDSIIDESIGREKEPMELFNERLEAVSQWAESVSDGNEEQTIAYAVNELYRTVDGATDDDSDVMNDSDTDFNRTSSGGIDLRTETK